ncbi:MAG: hypothetical protein ACRC67_16280 [Inquilinus sp.]|uniref:hypothetical protein n=1 Tax=Inquilinus sp. TaxID=1932117 RepID=UPI003F38ECC5
MVETDLPPPHATGRLCRTADAAIAGFFMILLVAVVFVVHCLDRLAPAPIGPQD